MLKTLKCALALLLAVMLLTALPVLAADSAQQEAADALHSLGLFQGTDAGYELDRAPTRAESLVMLIRLLGKESEALAYAGDCPLTDVSGRWMAPYVGWAYAEGLTDGMTETSFEPDLTAEGRMYAAFVLRALGYRDSEGDFSYSGAVSAAAELGIAPAEGYTGAFTRGDAVLMSYEALSVPCKGRGETLLETLIAAGAVDAAAAASLVGAPAPEADYLVACVGDSLTFGLTAPNPNTQSYPSVMATLTDGGFTFATENYGRSGATVDPKDDFFQANPYVASPEYADSIRTQADIVLVMLATNDAFWSPNRDVFEENYTALLQSYIDLPQAPQVIVVLPPHTFFEMFGVSYNDNLAPLIDKEIAVAEALGLPVIDAYSFNEGREELFTDTIHFTVEGYSLLAGEIYSQLCGILSAPDAVIDDPAPAETVG